MTNSWSGQSDSEACPPPITSHHIQLVRTWEGVSVCLHHFLSHLEQNTMPTPNKGHATRQSRSSHLAKDWNSTFGMSEISDLADLLEVGPPQPPGLLVDLVRGERTSATSRGQTRRQTDRFDDWPNYTFHCDQLTCWNYNKYCMQNFPLHKCHISISSQFMR